MRTIEILIGVAGVFIIVMYILFNPDPIELTQLNSQTMVHNDVHLETVALSSTHALLVDAQSGQIIMNQKGDEKIYPASLTKIMTTIVAIESLEDLNELIYIDGEMFPTLEAQSTTLAGFKPEEWIPAIDLLYGIMLPSGGESTIAVARAVAGSEERFVQLMNQKASELGLVNTHFVNPIGLHDPNHYTTAADMVTLLRYALNNETFKILFETPVYTTQTGLTLESTMFKNLPRTEVTHGEIIGGRTGFTLEAGRCLISLSRINDREYILVTAGAINSFENNIQHLLDAIYIFDQL